MADIFAEYMKDPLTRDKMLDVVRISKQTLYIEKGSRASIIASLNCCTSLEDALISRFGAFSDMAASVADMAGSLADGNPTLKTLDGPVVEYLIRNAKLVERLKDEDRREFYKSLGKIFSTSVILNAPGLAEKASQLNFSPADMWQFIDGVLSAPALEYLLSSETRKLGDPRMVSGVALEFNSIQQTMRPGLMALLSSLDLGAMPGRGALIPVRHISSHTGSGSHVKNCAYALFAKTYLEVLADTNARSLELAMSAYASSEEGMAKQLMLRLVALFVARGELDSRLPWVQEQVAKRPPFIPRGGSSDRSLLYFLRDYKGDDLVPDMAKYIVGQARFDTGEEMPRDLILASMPQDVLARAIGTETQLDALRKRQLPFGQFNIRLSDKFDLELAPLTAGFIPDGPGWKALNSSLRRKVIKSQAVSMGF